LRDNVITNDFEEYIINSIQGYERTIVYPDGEDIRLVQALKIFKNFNNINTILLGSENIISKNIK